MKEAAGRRAPWQINLPPGTAVAKVNNVVGLLQALPVEYSAALDQRKTQIGQALPPRA